jgi:polyisoprenoid-binding protein YceI
MRAVRAIAAVLACLAAAPAALAQARELTLDPAASEISFTLGTTLHEVHGTIHLKSGAIRFDPSTGEASGEIVVDARGADTGNEKRDAKMHGRILESERYPLIVFRPSRVDGSFVAPGHSALRLAGSMTLHGTDHPMTLPVAVDTEGERVRAVSTFQIPYVEWGMEDPSVFIIRADKIVDVRVQVEGRLGGGATPGKGTAVP